MIRTFKQHEIRKEEELEGFWDLYVLKGDPLPDQRRYQIYIPGCAESLPPLHRFHGLCRYERQVELKDEGDYLLTFYGVSFMAKVFWDGTEIGEHYNAYTRFFCHIKGVKAGIHTLSVEVDNRWDAEKSALHVPNDYESYNGIIRPVVIARISDTYIDRVQVTPYREDGVWKADYTAYIHGAADDRTELKVSLCGIQQKVAVREDGTASGSFAVPEAEAWSLGHPKLYEIHTTLLHDGVAIDDLTERFGFREIAVRDGQILLNDAPLHIHGFCRHEDYGYTGNALSVQSMAHDLTLMMDMGANAVRTSHYPNDCRFLDLCDELGILVWEENHARGLSEEQMHHPMFDMQCEECIEKMVNYDYNHPSIYIWGILNECASETAYGRACYQRQFQQIRHLDSSRPVTFASCKYFQDLCLDLVDVVSFNMYPLWYMKESPAEWLATLRNWIHQTEGAGKPMIISEFGAGAIAGFHDYSHCKWSEERQADILDQQLKDFIEDAQVTGLYIWMFADCEVAEDEWAVKRPKSENNKGVVDLYRRPKLAYDVVKKHYGSLKTPF